MISRLRKIRAEKGAYGGAGWANYVTTYFNDSLRFFTELNRVLRPNAMGFIVVGNSIIQGIEFKVDELLADLALETGWNSATIERVRSKRVGASITQSSVRRGSVNKASLYEAAVILEKA
jgi:hypothetical protein